jgi:beta-lactam-binding protein with PASTA domain
MIKRYFWLFPFLSFFTGFFFLRYFYYFPSFPTPVLVGKDIYQAVRILSDLTLNVRILKEQENNDLPQGTILYQIPDAGQPIKAHQSVFLVISHKSAALRMPNFIGKSMSAIEKEVQNLGISLKSYSITHNNYPSEVCFAQIPALNSIIQQKRITLYIATHNNKPILWPDFRNKTVQETHEFLLHHDIIPAYLIDTFPIEFEDIPPHAYIKDQRPFSGSLLILDSQHTLKPQFQIEL